MKGLNMRDRIADIIDQHGNGEAGMGMPNLPDAIIAALPSMVAPLVWDVDGRSLRLDDSLLMGKGYDWDGFELMREEANSPFGFGYIIWPDTISSDIYSLYCTLDGLYCQSLSETEAYVKANSDHADKIMSAFAPQEAKP